MLRPESRPFQRITSMEVTVALYAPDYVYEDAVLPDHVGESYRGLDGSLRAAETWIEPFEWLVVDLDQIIDAGERVVSLHRARAELALTAPRRWPQGRCRPCPFHPSWVTTSWSS